MTATKTIPASEARRITSQSRAPKKNDKRQEYLPIVGAAPTTWVAVTLSIPRAKRERLQEIADKRCKGAWRGAVKYTDVIREGIDIVLAREATAATTAKLAPKKKAKVAR
jgi:hypothetical protein